MTAPIRIGFALTGSFCTFARVMDVIQTLVRQGCEVTPILSFHAAQLDTRFGDAAMWRGKLFALTGRQPIDTIQAAEPIGPKGLFDVLVVAPCTGNTLAKLAHSVTDTPVVMAVKSHLRGDKPVVLAVSTNDGLSGSAANIGALLNRRYYYFVPFRQDAPDAKPRSLVADMERIPDTVQAALAGAPTPASAAQSCKRVKKRPSEADGLFFVCGSAQLRKQIHKLQRRQSRVRTLVARFGTRTLDGLLKVLGRNHAEQHGYACLQAPPDATPLETSLHT